MKYRPLANTGINISVIGFGAWGIGGVTPGATSYGATSDLDSLMALDAAFDCGINFYDTSSVYGNGHSEALIGRAFKTKRDKVIIASKAGIKKSYSGYDFSSASIRYSLESSLQRLQTDYLDILQLHNPDSGTLSRQHEEIDYLLNNFIKEGKIRAWGYSVKSPEEALRIESHSSISSIQVNFNLLDWRAYESGLFEKVYKKASVIARTPLACGFLGNNISRNTFFSPEDHRSAWNKDRVFKLVDAADILFSAFPDEYKIYTRSELALCFCLSFPAVTTVIPGIISKKEAVANALVGDIEPFPHETIMRLASTYHTLSKFLSV